MDSYRGQEESKRNDFFDEHFFIEGGEGVTGASDSVSGVGIGEMIEFPPVIES